MPKIDMQVAEAFCGGYELTTDNTVVTLDGKDVLLWGHRIAYEDGVGDIVVDNCGYHTRTTVNRLRAILEMYTDGHLSCGVKAGVMEFRFDDGTTAPFTKPTIVQRERNTTYLYDA